MSRHATVKMVVVNRETADAAPPSASASVEEKAPAPRASPAEARPEWVSGLATSSGRWMVRLAALLAGLLLWHYASSTGLTLYVRFEQIPVPFKVAQALFEQLQHITFF